MSVLGAVPRQRTLACRHRGCAVGPRLGIYFGDEIVWKGNPDLIGDPI
jgi:hypothetical protein